MTEATTRSLIFDIWERLKETQRKNTWALKAVETLINLDHCQHDFQDGPMGTQKCTVCNDSLLGLQLKHMVECEYCGRYQSFPAQESLENIVRLLEYGGWKLSRGFWHCSEHPNG